MPVDNLTNVNLTALVFTVIMGIFLLFLPRRLAIIPVVVTACYITMGQVVNIASLNFTLIRLIILVGWIRLLVRGELAAFRVNRIDCGIILWSVTSAMIYTIFSQSSVAFINQLGFLYNTLGIYFLFRCLIRDMNEVVLVVKALTIIIVPLALAMLLETLTQRNLFAVLGGVAEYSEIREGKLRAQGAFSHPILAGTFGATLIPLFVGLWQANRRFSFCTTIGIVAASLITVTSSSSGPLLTYLCGLTALAAWVLRHQMRVVRWCIVAGFALLHLVMNAPVWFLIARLSKVTGGTGWHRAELIDQSIRHLHEWWLGGTRYTAHWMPYALDINPDMADITNQYLRVGVDGGLLSLLLFVVLLVGCFSCTGKALAVAERNRRPLSEQMFLWSMGSALFAHAVTFFSVSYFDQIILFWLLLLAMIATAAGVHEPVRAQVPDTSRPGTANSYRYARLQRARIG